MENNIKKPMSVAKVELVKMFTDTINNCELPLFVVESVIRDIYVDVKRAADKQYEIDLAEYQKQLSGNNI